jgi:hypothetical protein
MKADANDILREHGSDGLRQVFDSTVAEPPALSQSSNGKAAPKASAIRATPFKWRDPSTIPTRKFLYGRHIIRGFVSVTAAPGGVGKTALKLVECVALATGRDLLGDGLPASTPVWYLGLEDPLEEYERRVAAIALHFGIPGVELERGLFLDSGRDQNFVIATEDRSRLTIIQPVVEAIVENVRRHGIGLTVVDPFVACHSVGENDNTRIEKVTREWARIAQATNCAVELVHHVRKSNGATEQTSDDVRGASAVVNAARSVRMLAQMTKEEAEEAGIEERRRFFRINVGKANLFLPSEKAQWRELVTLSLGNGGDGPDDFVGVAAQWNWPNALDGLHVSDLSRVQDKIATGEWAENSQAANWAGLAVADVLDLDPGEKTSKARIRSLLKTWLTSGALKTERLHNPRTGREQTRIVVGSRG